MDKGRASSLGAALLLGCSGTGSSDAPPEPAVRAEAARWRCRQSGVQKISTVSGRLGVLLATHADQQYIYWGAGDSVYLWKDGMNEPVEVAVVVDPVDIFNTSNRSVLLPVDGTIY